MSLAEREDMTIDEIIEKLKSDAVLDSYNFQGYSMKQKEQIAEWLEELKKLRELLDERLHEKLIYSKVKEDAYNKAIDDFEKEVMKQFTDFDLKHGYPTVTDCKIILRDIAEQLKSKTKL